MAAPINNILNPMTSSTPRPRTRLPDYRPSSQANTNTGVNANPNLANNHNQTVNQNQVSSQSTHASSSASILSNIRAPYKTDAKILVNITHSIVANSNLTINDNDHAIDNNQAIDPAPTVVSTNITIPSTQTSGSSQPSAQIASISTINPANNSSASPASPADSSSSTNSANKSQKKGVKPPLAEENFVVNINGDLRIRDVNTLTNLTNEERAGYTTAVKKYQNYFNADKLLGRDEHGHMKNREIAAYLDSLDSPKGARDHRSVSQSMCRVATILRCYCEANDTEQTFGDVCRDSQAKAAPRTQKAAATRERRQRAKEAAGETGATRRRNKRDRETTKATERTGELEATGGASERASPPKKQKISQQTREASYEWDATISPEPRKNKKKKSSSSAATAQLSTIAVERSQFGRMDIDAVDSATSPPSTPIIQQRSQGWTPINRPAHPEPMDLDTNNSTTPTTSSTSTVQPYDQSITSISKLISPESRNRISETPMIKQLQKQWEASLFGVKRYTRQEIDTAESLIQFSHTERRFNVNNMTGEEDIDTAESLI